MKQMMFSVASLVHYLKQTLDHDMNIQSILIKGEISNFTNHRSGHWYFTLKDAKAKISCVMFSSYASKCRLLLKEGMKVIVSASVSVYEPGGSLQLKVTKIELEGLGELFLELEQVKEKLRKEGFFDPMHKKPLPAYPMSIGVISAPSGAAIQDALRILSQRWPLAEVSFYASLVEGRKAADELLQTLKAADEGGHDVVLLIRGGGPIEGMWCFNDERLARCVFAMQTPIITGVGHETDTTLVDYVSDFRAPTPTGAALAATPDLREVSASLSAMRVHLLQLMRHLLQKQRNQLTPLKQHRYLQDPVSYIQDVQMQLAMHVKSLGVMELRLANHQKELLRLKQLLAYQAKMIVSKTEEKQTLQKRRLLEGCAHYRKYALQEYQRKVSLLDAFSPLKILDRGYSITYRGNALIHSIHEVEAQEEIRIRMRDGFLHAHVKKKEEL